MDEPTSTSDTLRFKNGAITLLINSDALTPISDLLKAIHTTLLERYPTGLPNPSAKPHPLSLSPTFNNTTNTSKTPRIPIPTSPTQIKLALPLDQNDPSKGWSPIKTSGRGGGLRNTAKALGMRDGGAIAFRFVEENEEEDLDDRDMEEDEESGDEIAGKGTAKESERFVVQWPSYDEAYPEEEKPVGDAEEDEDEEDEDEEMSAGAEEQLKIDIEKSRKRKIIDVDRD